MVGNSCEQKVKKVNSIKLAQNIPDTTKRNACVAAAFAFAYRYLKEQNFKVDGGYENDGFSDNAYCR